MSEVKFSKEHEWVTVKANVKKDFKNVWDKFRTNSKQV